MPQLSVHHKTVYRYRQPVRFGEHRLMFRPRDSHDMRLIDTRLVIAPQAEVRWLHDVFSNSIAIATFAEPSSELRFESQIRIQHYGLSFPDFRIEPYAQSFPFSYRSDEIPDLGRTIERHYPDPDGRVDQWAKRLVHDSDSLDTQEVLFRMTRAIQNEIAYERRYAVGTQAPSETLARRSGTCRDMALLMMEGVRAVGLAARFVTGYLYDPSLDQAGERMQGAGDTHAWCEVYLPGAGWVEFDPTNGLVGGANLIRVAVARDPGQAIPLQGSFTGAADDFIDMQVGVTVTANEQAGGW